MLAVVAIIIALFQTTYHDARQSILEVWEDNSVQLAKSTEYYLARPADAVEFSAAHVEELMAQGASNEEIGAYLVGEMDQYASLVENNYTGVLR